MSGRPEAASFRGEVALHGSSTNNSSAGFGSRQSPHTPRPTSVLHDTRVNDGDRHVFYTSTATARLETVLQQERCMVRGAMCSPVTHGRMWGSWSSCILLHRAGALLRWFEPFSLCERASTAYFSETGLHFP